MSDGVDRGPNGFPYLDGERSKLSQWENGEYHLKVAREDGELVSVNLTQGQFDAMREAFDHVDGEPESEEVTA